MESVDGCNNHVSVMFQTWPQLSLFRSFVGQMVFVVTIQIASKKECAPQYNEREYGSQGQPYSESNDLYIFINIYIIKSFDPSNTTWFFPLKQQHCRYYMLRQTTKTRLNIAPTNTFEPYPEIVMTFLRTVADIK